MVWSQVHQDANTKETVGERETGRDDESITLFESVICDVFHRQGTSPSVILGYTSAFLASVAEIGGSTKTAKDTPVGPRNSRAMLVIYWIAERWTWS